MMTAQSESAIACDPTPITPDQRERWVNEIVPQLYKAVQEIRELPDGYAMRLPSSKEMLMLVAEDLEMERLCCPFVRFTLEIEPDRGPFWLRFTGGEGVKAYLRMAFESANLFNADVAAAVGFNISAQTDIDSVDTVLKTIDSVNERFAEANDALS